MVGNEMCKVMSYKLPEYRNEDDNTFLWKDFLITDLVIPFDKKEMIKHFNENVLGFYFGTAAKKNAICDYGVPSGYLGCIPDHKKMDEFDKKSKTPNEFNTIHNNPEFHKKLQEITEYTDDLIPFLKENNIMEKMKLQSPVSSIDVNNKYGVEIKPLAVEDSKIIQDWYTSKPDDTKMETILKNGTVEVNRKNYKFTTRIYPVHYKITNMLLKIYGVEYMPNPNDDDTKNKNYKYTFYVKIFVEEIKPGTSDQNVPQEGTNVEEENNNVEQEDSNVQQGDPKNGGRKSRRKSSKKSRKSRRKSRKYKRNY
jgi:hypothetical protein